MADINLSAAAVAQLILSIGYAQQLNTTDKSTLVAAINEVLATAKAGGSPAADKVTYSGEIDGETVANVKSALDALTARKTGAADVSYTGEIDGDEVSTVKQALDLLAAQDTVLLVNAQQSISNTITADKTYAEIFDAVANNKDVVCVLTVAQIGSKAILRLENLGSAATFRQTYLSGNRAKTITLAVKDDNVWTMSTENETPAGIGAVPTTRKINGKALSADITLGSEDIGYSGTIGETTVENVKAALDALVAQDRRAENVAVAGAIGDAGSVPNTVENVAQALEALSFGQPLNVTTSFANSGAASVVEWAVAGSDIYNVDEGYYIIATTDTRYYVRILGVRAMTQRVVQIWKHGRDYIDPTLEIWRCTAPGSTPEMLLRYEADRGDLTIPNQRWDWQVPDYRGAKEGQVLAALGDGRKPTWIASLPMVTSADNGKFARVVGGMWEAQTLTNVAEEGA